MHRPFCCRLADLLDAPALLTESLAALACIAPGQEMFAPLLALAEARQYHAGLQRLKASRGWLCSGALARADALPVLRMCSVTAAGPTTRLTPFPALQVFYRHALALHVLQGGEPLLRWALHAHQAGVDTIWEVGAPAACSGLLCLAACRAQHRQPATAGTLTCSPPCVPPWAGVR